MIHILHDDQQRLLPKAVNLHDVLVLESFHDFRLALKVAEVRVGLDGAEKFDGDGRFILEGLTVLHAAAENAAVISLKTSKIELKIPGQKILRNSRDRFRPGK